MFDDTGMGGATKRPPSYAGRVRPTHLALLGALVVGWSAGRAAHQASKLSPAQESTQELPEQPADSEQEPRTSFEEGRVPRRRHSLRRAALAGGLVTIALFLSSTGISVGPEDARAPLLTPAARARQVREVARQADLARQRAENARLIVVRRLQTAGIAGRGVALQERARPRQSRSVQASSQTASPSGQESPLDQLVTALGPDALLAGLEASRANLQQQVLDDSRLQIYPAGRGDVASGRLDVRVLALLEYLAEAHGSVTVSCLITGHSLYVHGRPGVVSAHIYGRAVDISAVGGVPILGNQQPGGITEQTIRELLELPPPLEPVQVISLLTLGGPSFALPDHYNHIHIGY